MSLHYGSEDRVEPTMESHRVPLKNISYVLMLLVLVVRNRAVNKMDKTPPSKGNHFVDIWIKCVPDRHFCNTYVCMYNFTK